MRTEPNVRTLPYAPEDLAQERERLREYAKQVLDKHRLNAAARVNHALQVVPDLLVDLKEGAEQMGAEISQDVQRLVEQGKDKLMMVGFSATAFGAALKSGLQDELVQAQLQMNRIQLAVRGSLLSTANAARLGATAAVIESAHWFDAQVNRPLQDILRRGKDRLAAYRDEAATNRAARRAQMALHREMVADSMRSFRNSLESSLRRLANKLDPRTLLTTMKHRGDLLVIGVGPGKDIARAHALLRDMRQALGLAPLKDGRRTRYIESRLQAGEIEPLGAKQASGVIRNSIYGAAPHLQETMAMAFLSPMMADLRVLRLAINQHRENLGAALDAATRSIYGERALTPAQYQARRGETADLLRDAIAGLDAKDPERLQMARTILHNFDRDGTLSALLQIDQTLHGEEAYLFHQIKELSVEDRMPQPVRETLAASLAQLPTRAVSFHAPAIRVTPETPKTAAGSEGPVADWPSFGF